MTGEELPDYLRHHWPEIRAGWLSGRYRPRPVRRGERPKPGGGGRTLGLPTVLARWLPQAVRQVLQPDWAKPFADHSYGFRPARSAHPAMARAPQYLEDGYDGVVDLEREKFFDRVHHDQLLSLVKGRRADRRGLQRIDRYLTAGVLTGDGFEATVEGTPQGGPLSPLVANLLRDGFDQAWERRGHRFVRDADDSNLSVQSRRAGQRGRASGTRCLERRLPRTGHAAQRAVARPWRRTLRGFTCTRRRPHRRQGRANALQARTQEVRQRTCRTRGVSLQRVGDGLRQDLDGWYAYFRFPAGQSSFTARDSWGRRRLRCDVWQPWGRRRYRALRHRGVSRDLAWNTGKSAHGPWRLSRSPARAIALPGHDFDRGGVPRLSRRSRR
jgi:RNA-directed DNA polymerase